MKIKHRYELEALAAAGKCSLREAALQACYKHYTNRGYTLDVVKQFSDLKTDADLFRVFDHIQEREALQNTKTYRRSGYSKPERRHLFVWVKPGNQAKIIWANPVSRSVTTFIY